MAALGRQAQASSHLKQLLSIRLSQPYKGFDALSFLYSAVILDLNASLVQSQMTYAEQEFEGLILERSGVLFVNGTDASQMGSLTLKAVALVRRHLPGARIVDISRDMHLRRAAQRKSKWDFFPQFFLRGEFIGGSMILEEFFRSDEHGRIVGKGSTEESSECAAEDLPFKQATKIWRLAQSHADPVVVAASACGSLYSWNFSRGFKATKTKIFDGWVNCAAVSSSTGIAYAGLTDGSIRACSEDAHISWQAHGRWVNDLAISAGGERLWSVSADRSLAVWDCSDLKLLSRVPAHDDCVWSVCVGESQQVVLTGDAGGNVKAWEADTLSVITSCRAHDGCVTAICSAGEFFCSSSFDGSIAVFSAHYKIIGRFSGHTERVWTVAWISGSDHCASASGDGTVRVWNIESQEEASRHYFSAMPIAVLPVAKLGGLMVSLADGSVSLLELNDGFEIISCRTLLPQ